MGNVYRVYTGKDGLTHSEVMNVFPAAVTNLLEATTRGAENRRKALSIGFRNQAAGFFGDWHTVEKPVFSITVSGELEYGLSDGTVLKNGPGDTVLFEDFTGKGHTTRIVGKQPRLSMAVELA